MTRDFDNWRRDMPIGVVIRRTPGVTRWAKWNWLPVAVLPGAPEADWKEMRREGEAVEYHAGTLMLTLHRAEIEAYQVCLQMKPPSVYVVLDQDHEGVSPSGYVLSRVTASAYEAQDYLDSGESIVESVPMPPLLAGWVAEFVEMHYEGEHFVKRVRDKKRVDLVEDGVGDERITQEADVYRAPGSIRKRWTN